MPKDDARDAPGRWTVRGRSAVLVVIVLLVLLAVAEVLAMRLVAG